MGTERKPSQPEAISRINRTALVLSGPHGVRLGIYHLQKMRRHMNVLVRPSGE